jgi:hypothetical protein
MSFFAPRYADGEQLEIAGMSLRLRVSRRARRVSLKVDRLRGEVVAVAPSARRLADAVAFAKERHDWVAKRLAELPTAKAPGWTEGLTLFGAPCVLQPDGRRPRLILASGEEPWRLVGCGAGVVDPQLAARAIKREALAVFTRAAARHCQRLGVSPPPIQVGDAATRWGSCLPPRPGRGPRIRLSWRLALAPFEVADYVVAHECAHLIEGNHGPRFWSLVRGLVGDEKPHRAWLGANGPQLHAFGRPR